MIAGRAARRALEGGLAILLLIGGAVAGPPRSPAVAADDARVGQQVGAEQEGSVPAGPARPEAAEIVAISEVELVPGAPAEEGVLRVVQVGNPPRRPPLPDLSRAGVHELPGRVSLEVPALGVRVGEQWLPPGIYRLALATEGLEPRLRARPLAPGRDIDLAIESGTMTAPAARFRCHLGERHVERERTAYFTLRWGALSLEATITAPPPRRLQAGRFAFAAVPEVGAPSEETYLGEIVEGEGEPRSARWLRGERQPRLRLERERRRRLFGLHREYLARAEWLAGMSRSALDAGDSAEATRIGRIAESYDERAAQLEKSLSALEGDGEEILGSARPAAGDRVEVSLSERGNAVALVIDAPGGGAEFLLGGEGPEPR